MLGIFCALVLGFTVFVSDAFSQNIEKARQQDEKAGYDLEPVHHEREYEAGKEAAGHRYQFRRHHVPEIVPEFHKILMGFGYIKRNFLALETFTKVSPKYKEKVSSKMAFGKIIRNMTEKFHQKS